MKRLIIRIILILADLLGINWLFRSINSDKIRILMYHGVSDLRMASFYWTLLAKDNFLWQLEYLSKKYNVIAPDLLYKEVARTKDSVVITFDDGLLNNYSEVIPALKKYNFTAACFVLPGLSESGEFMWTDRIYSVLMDCNQGELNLTDFDLGVISFDEGPTRRSEAIGGLVGHLKGMNHERREEILSYIFSQLPQSDDLIFEVFQLMSPDQIIEMSKSEQFHIGAHTNRHPILSTMSAEEQEREIAGGMDKLKKWGVTTMPVFAYPNGRAEDFNDETVQILKKLNFKAALTTIDGLHNPDDDLYHIKRINIGADIDKWEFRARLSGFFYFLQGRKG